MLGDLTTARLDGLITEPVVDHGASRRLTAGTRPGGVVGVDVLIQAEQIGGVVSPLQRGKATVVLSKRRPDELGILPEPREVEVGLAGTESLHGGEESAGPGDVSLRLLGDRPVRQNLEEEG